MESLIRVTGLSGSFVIWPMEKSAKKPRFSSTSTNCALRQLRMTFRIPRNTISFCAEIEIHRPLPKSHVSLKCQITKIPQWNHRVACSPRKVDALAEAIVKLLKDDVLRSSMKKEIEKKYHQGEFAWKNIAKHTVRVYAEAIADFKKSVMAQNVSFDCDK